MFFIPLARLPRSAARVFSCKGCGVVVTREEDLIEVMGRPVKVVYHNPQGIPCEIWTFSSAGKLAAGDFATQEYSWFEGYAWRPVGCGECKLHLGWRFEASESHLDPRIFYGFLVEALRERAEGHAQV